MLWGVCLHYKTLQIRTNVLDEFHTQITFKNPNNINKKSTSAGINLLIHSPITTSLQIVSKLQTIHRITHQAVREPIRENISTSTKIKLSDNSISHKTL